MSIVQRALDLEKMKQQLVKAPVSYDQLQPPVKDYLADGLAKHAVNEQSGYLYGQKAFKTAGQTLMYGE